jgi:hypothetical protein
MYNDSTCYISQFDTSISDTIVKFNGIMKGVMTDAEAMLKVLHGLDLKDFEDRLRVELFQAFEELKEDFSEPLPENQTERYKQQKIMITHALEKAEDALVNVCGHWEIPENTVRTNFDRIKPHIIYLLLIVGK